MLVHMYGVCECVCITIDTSGRFILLLSGHFRRGQTILNTESEASRQTRIPCAGGPGSSGSEGARHQTKTKVSEVHRYVNTSLAPYSICLLRLTKLPKAKKPRIVCINCTCTEQDTHTPTQETARRRRAYGYGSVPTCCQLDAYF